MEKYKITSLTPVVAALAMTTFFQGELLATVETQVTPDVYRERLDWFQDQRYGMFIHWGPSVIHGGAYDGTELSWSRGGNPPDAWCKGGSIPPDIYDQSFQVFNPVDYNPQDWVQLAKEAGMRYMVFTARHHDGFSMFDTEHSDFKITHPEGAYRRRIAEENPDWTEQDIDRKADIVRQFTDAVRAGGLGVGIYYSEPDWRREDYRIALTGRNGKGEEVSDAERVKARKSYQDFMHAQLEELTTRYGRIDILWLDAIKPSQVIHDGWDALWIRRETWEMVRQNQPGILINDRHDMEPDFYTPEGSDAPYRPGVIQESCQHMGRQWSWSPEDRVPSLNWLIDRIVINASRSSNVLLNLGPSPKGTFDPAQADRIREAGEWLKEYGIAVIGTRGGPLIAGEGDPSFVTTQREETIFVHVLRQEEMGKELYLPGVDAKSAHMFDSPEEMLQLRAEEDGVYINLGGTKESLRPIIVVTRRTNRH